MSCLLIVAVFNTINAGILVDAGPPAPFWIVIIVNYFCITMDCSKVRIVDQIKSASFYGSKYIPDNVKRK